MDEFKYVIKCFLFAALVMTFSQVETEGITWESKAEVFLTESKAAHFMKEAATGGAHVIKEAFFFSKRFVSEKMNGASSKRPTRSEDNI